jgi:septum formation protein
MLLAQIGLTPDRVITPDVNEAARPGELPRPYAVRMARDKAAAIPCPGSLVLAADTVVAVGRRILPKAETMDDVRSCLRLVSGRRHRVLTAVALIATNGKRSERLSESTVTFNRLTEEQIERYAACGEGLGKAGGYAINGQVASLVRAMTGSFSGIVGLPLFETAQLLRAHGYRIP